ncbi:hypothetical protein FACS189449_13130 [Alphaproteobacteria bacterium]|nr:hypothetical protein FACS189449_13130 [Alphaproteobacteria bacterium]
MKQLFLCAAIISAVFDLSAATETGKSTALEPQSTANTEFKRLAAEWQTANEELSKLQDECSGLTDKLQAIAEEPKPGDGAEQVREELQIVLAKLKEASAKSNEALCKMSEAFEEIRAGFGTYIP